MKLKQLILLALSIPCYTFTSDSSDSDSSLIQIVSSSDDEQHDVGLNNFWDTCADCDLRSEGLLIDQHEDDLEGIFGAYVPESSAKRTAFTSFWLQHVKGPVDERKKIAAAALLVTANCSAKALDIVQAFKDARDRPSHSIYASLDVQYPDDCQLCCGCAKDSIIEENALRGTNVLGTIGDRSGDYTVALFYVIGDRYFAYTYKHPYLARYPIAAVANQHSFSMQMVADCTPCCFGREIGAIEQAYDYVPLMATKENRYTTLKPTLIRSMNEDHEVQSVDTFAQKMYETHKNAGKQLRNGMHGVLAIDGSRWQKLLSKQEPWRKQDVDCWVQ